MWYSVKTIYKSEYYKDGKKIQKTRPLYEEIIFLVKAKKLSDAKKAAKKITKSEETSYMNSYGQLVKWRVLKVIEIQELEEKINHGSEVSSRHFYNLSAYKKFDSQL